MTRAGLLEAEDQLPRAPDVLWFPQHTQEHGMTCAAACARMIAEWLTNELWTEKEVAKAIGWNGSYRPSYAQRKKLAAFLRRAGGESRWAWCHSSIEERDRERERLLRDDLLLTDAKRPKMLVAMLLVAAYRCNARLAHTSMTPVNVGHWLIARSIRRVSTELDSEVRAKTVGTPMVDLAVVHDPAFTEPYFETWDSLCGRVIDSALVVGRRARPRRVTSRRR